jgi:dolichyl-phosphate-mannose--protein O-mannosyl transferase
MSDAASHFSIAVAVIIAIVDLWGIVNVIRSDNTVKRKAAWVIGIIVFPVVGWIVWSYAAPLYAKKNTVSRKPSKK